MEIVPIEKNFTFDNIIDNLYLGDIESATSSNLIKSKIEIVVNISNTHYNELNNVQYYHYDIDDESDVDISKYFDEFINIVNNNKEKNILVHCQNSVSRSVTLVLAYLISRGNTLVEAFEYLKSKRTQYTCPNRGFLKQLSEYEMNIYGSISINPIAMFKNLRK